METGAAAGKMGGGGKDVEEEGGREERGVSLRNM